MREPGAILRLLLMALLALGASSCLEADGRDGDDDNDDEDAGSDTDGDTDTDGDGDGDSDTDADGDGDCGLDVHEPFTVSGLPAGWVVTDFGNDGYTWSHTTVGNDIGYDTEAGHMVVSSGSGPGVSFQEELATAEYTVGTCQSVTLGFTHRFLTGGTGTGDVLIDVDGAGWSTLTTYSAADNDQVSMDISSEVSGATSFKVGFLYTAQSDESWKLDNFVVTGSSAKGASGAGPPLARTNIDTRPLRTPRNRNPRAGPGP